MVKLKLSSFLMLRTCSQLNKAVSKKRKLKRKQKRKVLDGNLCANNGGINKLPDELLVNILSCMSLKEVARTSVLARKWKYLWTSVFKTLQFDFRDVVTASGDLMEVEKFCSWVSTVLELHQGRYIEGLVILFEGMHEQQYERVVPRTCRAINSWVGFAVQEEVRRFELRLSSAHGYEFPSIDMLKSNSHSHVVFCRLRSLILVNVEIKDEVVHYLLSSCHHLEHLCIWDSSLTRNLQVTDPPSLRVLEIKGHFEIQSVEISAERLVSLSYTGKENVLMLKKIPNLRELTIGGDSFLQLVREAKKHYSTILQQLVKFVVYLPVPICRKPLVGVADLPQLWSLKRLEVRVCSVIGRSLLFFTSIIMAAPQLREFRIEISYLAYIWLFRHESVPFPVVSGLRFNHTNLKVVEMEGYVGCSSEGELLLELLKNTSSIDKVVIDTRSKYYDDPELAMYTDDRRRSIYPSHLPVIGATRRAESIERAKHLVSTFPHHIKSVIS